MFTTNANEKNFNLASVTAFYTAQALEENQLADAVAAYDAATQQKQITFSAKDKALRALSRAKAEAQEAQEVAQEARAKSEEAALVAEAKAAADKKTAAAKASATKAANKAVFARDEALDAEAEAAKAADALKAIEAKAEAAKAADADAEVEVQEARSIFAAAKKQQKKRQEAEEQERTAAKKAAALARELEAYEAAKAEAFATADADAKAAAKAAATAEAEKRAEFDMGATEAHAAKSSEADDFAVFSHFDFGAQWFHATNSLLISAVISAKEEKTTAKLGLFFSAIGRVLARSDALKTEFHKLKRFVEFTTPFVVTYRKSKKSDTDYTVRVRLAKGAEWVDSEFTHADHAVRYWDVKISKAATGSASQVKKAKAEEAEAKAAKAEEAEAEKAEAKLPKASEAFEQIAGIMEQYSRKDQLYLQMRITARFGSKSEAAKAEADYLKEIAA